MHRAAVAITLLLLCASIANAVPEFQAQLNWPSTGEGAFGGNSGFPGTQAMMATIPFTGTKYSDIGLIPNQVSFGVGGSDGVEQVRNNPVSWTFALPIAKVKPAPEEFTSMLGPTVYVTGVAPGKTTLTATAVGPPMNVAVSAPVYVYQVIDVGCVDGGALGGVSFASDGRYKAPTTIAASDLYVTGPDCGGAFHDARATGETVHVPLGGTLLADSITRGQWNIFMNFPAKLWRKSFTALNERAFADAVRPYCKPEGSPTPVPCPPWNTVLFLKTKTGAIVKMQLIFAHHATTSGKNLVGAYEITNPAGVFPY